MGGQRFGIEGNAKTNEIARQQRQMNGYPLRSFLATGGPIILPPKHGEGLMATPMNIGLTQYTQYNAVAGQRYVSEFTEPLNAPLENNTILLAKAGIKARTESASDPFKAATFMNNMHSSLEEIRANEIRHLELRGFNRQDDVKQNIAQLEDNAQRLAKRQKSEYDRRREGYRPPLPPKPTRNAPARNTVPPVQRVEEGEEGGYTFRDGADEEDAQYDESPEERDIRHALYGARPGATEVEEVNPHIALHKEALDLDLRDKVMNELGADIYHELDDTARNESITFKEAFRSYADRNPGTIEIMRARVQKAKEEYAYQQEKDRRLAAYRANQAKQNTGTMISQVDIAQNNLTDGGGGLLVLSEDVADQARIAYQNIGSQNGIAQTPVRNSEPSSAITQSGGYGSEFGSMTTKSAFSPPALNRTQARKLQFGASGYTPEHKKAQFVGLPGQSVSPEQVAKLVKESQNIHKKNKK